MEADVQKSIAGDRDAFGRLYDMYSARIYRYLYYRTWNRHAAEDLASTVFLKALEGLPAFGRSGVNFNAWLYRIAHNCLIDYYRAYRSHRDIDTVWDLGAETSLETDAENQDQWERLKPYLRELQPEALEVLILRVWDEVPYKEIARITGKSENACKMVFSRAIAQLRQLMPLSVFLLFLFQKKI